jgi:hypothetical protein
LPYLSINILGRDNDHWYRRLRSEALGHAPISKIASYGIVGDYNQVVPILIEEFRKRLSR